MNDKRANGAAVAQRFYTPNHTAETANDPAQVQTPKRPVYEDAPVGERFNRWTVLAYDGRRHGRALWFVRCDCGAEYTRFADTIARGRSKQCNDCGILDGAAIRAMPERSKLPGSDRQRPEYKAYLGMIARCDDPSRKFYYRYGGRGIGVCDRWREERTGFANFYADLGPRPGPGYSVERVDNDGDYEPGNVKWATKTEQARNTRRNHVIEIDGRAQCIAAWAQELGIRPQIISTRLRRGWSERDAVLGRKR